MRLPVPLSPTGSYSEQVRTELKRLVARARACGAGQQVLAALKEIDRRLHVYPQFGDPMRDLKFESTRLWVAVVPPLIVRYILDEERRLVLIGTPLQTLPNAGF